MSIFSKIGKALTGVIRPVGNAISSIFTGRSGTGIVNTLRPPVVNSSTASANVSLISDFADVILKYDNTQVYTDKALRCASYVKRPVARVVPIRNEPPAPKKKYQDYEKVERWYGGKGKGSGLRVAYIPDSRDRPGVSVNRPQITDVQDVIGADTGSKARANVFAFMDDVLSFATQAKNAGFSPPDNPFVEISRLNAERKKNSQIAVSESSANDLVFNIQTYVDLLEARDQGAIDLSSGMFNSSQLEHVTLSYSGLGGTGNNAADLMRLLPNADELKAKKAADALSVLNFSKRVPNVVFVAEFNPNQDDGSKGILVGWKRMQDAAGYIVKRHSVIGNKDEEFDVPNENLNDQYLDYAKAYILTFYDQIRPESVCLFLDSNPPDDDYYIYTIQAYQIKKGNATSIIPSSFVTMNLTGVQKMAINTRIHELDPADIDQIGEETISPWPVMAEQLFGDASLDWILSAANIRASIDRGDEKADTRKYSYLNSHVKFLISQSDAGKFVRPSSMDDVRQAVINSIQTYGITQTIEALLQETGVLYYFDGRDSREDSVFDRAGTLDVATSGIVGAVAAAIDPESATIDLRSLATNLAGILSDGNMEDYTTSLEMASKKAEGAKPSEIDIDPDLTNDKMAESGVQFVAKLGDMTDTSVDLATFDGIAKMIRVIRVMSDFGPNRIQPKVPVAVTPPVVAVEPERIIRNEEHPENLVLTSAAAERALAAGKVELAVKIERAYQAKEERRVLDGGKKRSVE